MYLHKDEVLSVKFYFTEDEVYAHIDSSGSDIEDVEPWHKEINVRDAQDIVKSAVRQYEIEGRIVKNHVGSKR